AVKLLELLAGDGDGADVLVAHDHRIVERRLRVHLHVGAADACHLDLQQRGVVRQLRHGQLAKLGCAWRRPNGGEDTVDHRSPRFVWHYGHANVPSQCPWPLEAGGEMSDRELTTLTRTQGANQALRDGTVTPAGYSLRFEEIPVL